jgi:hypothetical protein
MTAVKGRILEAAASVTQDAVEAHMATTELQVGCMLSYKQNSQQNNTPKITNIHLF